MKNLETGKTGVEAASVSDDLAGAARIAPLVYRYRNDPGRLVDSARRQTALTHNSPMVLGGADFFSRVACRALQGVRPVEAMRQVAAETAFDEPIKGCISAGLSSASEDTRSAMHRFGQMCETDMGCDVFYDIAF